MACLSYDTVVRFGIAPVLGFVVAALLPVHFAAAQSRPAVWIHAEDGSRVVVETRDVTGSTSADAPGWLIYQEGPESRCLRLPSVMGSSASLPSLGGGTRGDFGPDSQALAISTAELDQLASGELVRAAREGGLLTPVDQGIQISGAVTFRRAPRSTDSRYPADRIRVQQGRTSWTCAFPESVAALRWEELPNRPEDWKDGLPPGRYLVRLEQAGTEATFHVARSETAFPAWKRIQEQSEQLRGADPNLMIQLRVESLLRGAVVDGQPVSFLADALEAMEGVDLVPHLQKVKSDLLARLSGEDELAEEADQELAAIDGARQLIARGDWSQALDVLNGPDAAPSRRAARLASLYRGVTLAESSATLFGEAEGEFKAALQDIDQATPEDAYRIQNNYGNFLLRRVQNGMNNRVLRAASGGTDTLFDLLQDWQSAEQQYTAAHRTSEKLGSGTRAAANVGLARLQAALSDILFTIDSALPAADRLTELESLASTRAQEFARAALAPDSGADPMTRATALEVLAQIALRQGRWSESREHATEALRDHAAVGSLLGAEGVLRLIGLSYLNEPVARDPKQRDRALEALIQSHVLSEHLREQYPGDTIGLGRAGFLSRRAFVTSRIVELLLETAQFRAALEFTESARARALSDVLSVHRTPDSVEQPAASDPGDAAPARSADLPWPEKTVALQYFLGTDQVWVFCVAGPDEVTAHRLTAGDGTPLSTPKFVADLRTFLTSQEGAAGKMLRSTAPGQPFNSDWQHTLHRYWNELIPAEVRPRLAQAETVVLIPQHLLHYFPFPALVTEVDLEQRGGFESAMPKFWIESGVNLVHAPSLAAWKQLRSAEPQSAGEVNAIGIATFANAKPLPGVNSDLANLQRNFGTKVASLSTGSSVTEGLVRSALEHPGLVFVGTHGANLPDSPLASYLLCHADSENDGHFMAGEIYGSRFQCCIALLSACYSGLADRSPLAGDDLFGIERALLHAGVKTVVAGVWDVYDATGTEIMNHVFESLVAGRTTHQAVADAQRVFLKDRRKEGPGDPWIHPYFWAVYKVTGSDRTRFGGSGLVAP